jgi:hypothetical protein
MDNKNTDTIIHTQINTQNTVEPEIDSVGQYFIDNLIVISSIKSGDKLYIDKNTMKICIDQPFILQGLWRYYNNVSRRDTIFTLNKIYNDIEIYINAMLLKESEKQRKNNQYSNKLSHKLTTTIILFMDKITKTLTGLDNLKQTYELDTEILSDLNKLIVKANTLVMSFRKMLI